MQRRFSFLAAAIAAAGCAGSHGASAIPATPQGGLSRPAVAQRGNLPLNWVRFPQFSHAHGLAGIAAGPDGNVWFTNMQSDTLSRITMDGKETAFPLAASGKPFRPGSLAVGADGRFYLGGCVVSRGGCARSTVAAVTTAGALTPYSVPSGDGPGTTNGLALGPDGNVWFAESSHFAKITTGGTVTEYPYPSGETKNEFAGVTVGPDHHVWFTERDTNNVGSVDPSTGKVSEVDLLLSGIGTCGAAGMTTGGDRNLYFGCGSFGTSQVAQLSASGYGQTFPNSNGGIPNAQAFTTGRDGNVYISANGELDYFDTSKGLLNAYAPPWASQFGAVAAARDGNIWALDTTGNVSVYILSVLNVYPASVTGIGPSDQQTVTAYYSGTGTLTARSNHPGTARVNKGRPKNTFVITQTGYGNATITVSDGLGNSFPVSFLGT
jgi:streptogramin lyase